jgi:hypothetical protein
MIASVHRPLKVIAVNANGIWRRRHELSKQLQDLHIPHEKFFLPNYYFYRTDRFPGRKAFTITMYTYAVFAIRTLDKGEACC